ncbi:hypothetical protein C8R43DRAFT_1086878 [Mycena crocata]|nr:hypothetical protein C8R43DRAFT_1086878 [Mycena crocata]
MRLCRLALVSHLLGVTCAARIPLQTTHDLQAQPDANATGHLIFETVNSLLQHWPNTRYRNGHTIVPGIVRVGTPLYHGRENSSLPTIPDWTATDPEHSYHFWGGEKTPSRAANMKSGTLDAQDLLVCGKADPKRWLDERGRINNLCAWGKEFGIGGYMREIMLCDFHTSVELLSADFLASWWTHRIDPPLWHDPASRLDALSTPPRASSNFKLHSASDIPRRWTRPIDADLLRLEMVRAGSWHYSYPGDTRVILDYTRLVSFYDTSLLRGVDWRTLFRVPIDRYAERLTLLAHLLNTTTAANATDAICTPRREASSSSVESDAWAVPVWRACTTRHTAQVYYTPPPPPIHASRSLQERMTPSEQMLLRAFDDTSPCGVRAGLDGLLPPPTSSSTEPSPELDTEGPSLGATEISHIVDSWRADTQALMAWLDWSVWVKCSPACGPLVGKCYLPTWPYFWSSFPGPDDEGKGDGAWERPQPRCIRQVEPFEFRMS